MADNVPITVPAPARGLADIPGLKQVGLLAGVAAAVAAVVNTTHPTASSEIGRRLKRNSFQFIATAEE